MKKLVISEFSGIAFERNVFATVNLDDFHFAEKLLITDGKQEPIMITNILTVGKKHSDLIVIAFVWKDLLKTILTEKLRKMFGSENEFVINFLKPGLKKMGLRDEKELIEKFPNTKELIILLNNTNRNVDVDIPNEMSIPKVFSSV